MSATEERSFVWAMLAWLLRVFSFAALAGFAAAVWYAGPLIAYDEARPLEDEGARLAVIAAAVAVVGAYYSLQFWRARRAQKALEAVIAKAGEDDSDAAILKERMAAAVVTLKRKGGSTFLRDQPWYVIIGPPGAGKTTALVNSGLDFPLAGGGVAEPVAGVGGTRFCDWWFAEGAVLIDTAGRYTTLEADAARDKKSWLAFLSTLKEQRPLQPINGVILAISLHDLMTLGGHTLGAHVAEIRSRLDEIAETLRINFPVYVLFTKVDLISGFTEFFSGLDESGRRKAWGATFQTHEVKHPTADQAAFAFDMLADRVAEETTDRLAEADKQARQATFGFPAQFASLKQAIAGFLTQIFDAGHQKSGPILRGFYFASGTQEGTPIDQFLGSAGRAFGTGPRLSGKGRSFFLHDVLKRVIFAESGWVSYDRAAARRSTLLRVAGLGGVTVAVAVALATLGFVVLGSRSQTADIRAALESYRSQAAPLLTQATVAQPDLETVVGPLDIVRDIPTGRADDLLAAPRQILGLGQGERLQSAARIAYRQGLERLFRPRLLVELQQEVAANAADPAAIYEPLKAYLMLTGAAPRTDDEFLVAWFLRDWEDRRYPGAPNREGRQQLEKHLRAMLALDDAYDPLYQPDRGFVETAQRSLGTLSLADLATALIRTARHAANSYDLTVTSAGGAQSQLVFETTDASALSSVAVPGFYTYRGFNDVLLPELADIARRLAEDQWVVGPSAARIGLEQELQSIGPELLDRYGKDFVVAWTGAIDRLKLKSLTEDAPQYAALSAVAAADSPIIGVLQSIADQTALTREPTPADAQSRPESDLAVGLARIGLALSTGKSQNRAGLGSTSAGLPAGAAIEAQFRPFQAVVGGRPGQRPIDILVQNFRDIYRSLLLADSAQNDRAAANLQLQIANLRTNASRLPKQFAAMVVAAADEFEGEAAESSLDQLNAALRNDITALCQQVIGNRYPFNRDAAEELPLADFAKLFAPGGAIDRFFARNLSALVEFSEPDWQWKQDSRLGRQLSTGSLRPFQLAAQLRDAFFSSRTALPSLALTVTPQSLHNDADLAFLEINGKVVQSYHTGNAPMVIDWPGDSPTRSSSLSIQPELQGRESRRRFTGDWALKRLLDTADAGGAADVRFILGGRDVAYALEAGSGGNPFALPAFSAFVCPDSL